MCVCGKGGGGSWQAEVGAPSRRSRWPTGRYNRPTAALPWPTGDWAGSYRRAPHGLACVVDDHVEPDHATSLSSAAALKTEDCPL